MRANRAALVIVMALSLGGTVSCGASNTATLAGDSGSPAAAATTFKVGDAVKLGDFTVKVISVKDPYKSTNSMDTPAKGTRFVAVDTQVQNTGSTPQTVSSLMCFDVSDATGQQYTMALVLGAPKPPDGEVAPGKAIRGTLVYEIPTAQKSLTMDFKCDLLSSGSATIKLK